MDNIRTITVIMSAYNGSKYIEAQLDSIFRQEGVKVLCYVRDDGSTDDTLQVLKSYTSTSGELIICEGENIGWERSFLLALKDAPKADYYAFADQDDIWFEDKLISGIKMLEKEGTKNKPCMYHCNKVSVTEDLKPLAHQVRRTPRPLNRQNALIQEYAQGCSIIMNEYARQLVTKYIPLEKVAHDFWCGLLCYLFGEVIYDNMPHFYHISHGNNASGEGHMIGSWKGRLKKFFEGGTVYYTPFLDLEKGYADMLSKTDKKFILKLKYYKKSFKAKLSLLFSFQFVRDSILGTCSLKMAVLFNKL